MGQSEINRYKMVFETEPSKCLWNPFSVYALYIWKTYLMISYGYAHNDYILDVA